MNEFEKIIVTNPDNLQFKSDLDMLLVTETMPNRLKKYLNDWNIIG